MTGATGFIGSHVAFRLLDKGHELVVLARNEHKTTALSHHPNVTRLHATLYDFDTIRTALDGCRACIHIALGWGDTPVEMLKTDTTATVSLLQSCVDAGVEHFLYTSSTAVMGTFQPRMDELTPPSPTDNYGATKLASEAYVLAVEAASEMRCNIIRPGYTFGNPAVAGAPIQPDRRFADIVQKARRGDPISLDAGDGTQFIWAGDLAALYEAVLCSPRSREIYFGLGTPFVTWEAIAKQAVSMTQSSSAIALEGTAKPPCLFDLSKIKTHFGLAFSALPYVEEHLRYFMKD